jgi:hypothetical protein
MINTIRRWRNHFRTDRELLEAIMADLTRLNAAVTANTEAVAAVSAKIDALSTDTDQAGIDAAATQIEANNKAMQDKVNPPAPTP